MADEADVQNFPLSRFFCHKCLRDVRGVQADFLCPYCRSGFIESMERTEGGERGGEEAADDSDSEIELRPFEFFTDVMMSFNTADGGYRGRGPNRTTVPRQNNRLNWSRQMGPLENILQEFLVNISGVSFGAATAAGPINIAQRGGQVLFLGNPGDYAWGREGLDAIVTQLLNQMDSTGPPPLDKEKIQEIPSVVITQQQVELNLQCSVCWEDFKCEESVRKLPCEHFYHDNCIVPWLELHGTCPICRKTLLDESQTDTSENATDPVGTSLAALFRAANESIMGGGGSEGAGGGTADDEEEEGGEEGSSEPASAPASSVTSSSATPGASTTTTTPPASAQAQDPHSSSTTRPDFNMDIDFD